MGVKLKETFQTNNESEFNKLYMKMAKIFSLVVLGGMVLVVLAGDISVTPDFEEVESPKLCTRTQVRSKYSEMDVAWTVGGLKDLLEFSKGCSMKVNLKLGVKENPRFPGNMSIHIFNTEEPVGMLNIIGAFEDAKPKKYSLKVSVMIGSEVYIPRNSARNIPAASAGIQEYYNYDIPSPLYNSMYYDVRKMGRQNVTLIGFGGYSGIGISELAYLAESESNLGNTVDEFTFVFKIAALDLNSEPITESVTCDSRIPTYDELVASHPVNFTSLYGY